MVAESTDLDRGVETQSTNRAQQTVLGGETVDFK